MAYELWGQAGLTKEGQLVTFEKRLLNRFRGETVFNRFGTQASIPKQGGKSISFRRLEAHPSGSWANIAASGPAVASGPPILTEGTPGTAVQLTWSEVLASIDQFGQYMQVTDLAQLQSIDELMPQYVEQFSEAMKEGLDLRTRDILNAGTNVIYSGTTGSRGGLGSTNAYLTLADLRKAKRNLLKVNAHPVKSEGAKFVVITHPDVLFDLESDSNITNIWQYAGDRGDNNQLFDVAFRDLPLGFRLYVTSLSRQFFSLGLSGADVYATLVLGEEAYGTIKVDTLPTKVIVHGPGSSGAYDPLDQVGTVGWKAAHAAVILNQNNMIRVESTSSSKNAA